jgi:hypothetical protein
MCKFDLHVRRQIVWRVLERGQTTITITRSIMATIDTLQKILPDLEEKIRMKYVSHNIVTMLLGDDASLFNYCLSMDGVE